MGMQSFLHAGIRPSGECIFQRKEGIGDTPEIRLPVRQFTWHFCGRKEGALSKLPVRQFTLRQPFKVSV